MKNILFLSILSFSATQGFCSGNPQPDTLEKETIFLRFRGVNGRAAMVYNVPADREINLEDYKDQIREELYLDTTQPLTFIVAGKNISGAIPIKDVEAFSATGYVFGTKLQGEELYALIEKKQSKELADKQRRSDHIKAQKALDAQNK
jgi:hypothetical protein